jgi:glycosyltransferase involved in cell wall biosynthesis
MSHRVSIVVPAYNESAFIGSLIERIDAVDTRSVGFEKEIIVVDDGSTDGTSDVVQPFVREGLLLLRQENMGKGRAVQAGVARATGEYILVQDADLEYDPADYPLMLQPILNNQADVVYGSRFIGHRPHRVLYFWHRVGNGLLTLLSNLFTNLNLTDIETGFKAFRGDVIRSLQIEEDRFGFEPEVTAKVARGGYRIYEVGIAYFGRTYAEGKKIGWRDGVRAVWCILKYNLRR